MQTIAEVLPFDRDRVAIMVARDVSQQLRTFTTVVSACMEYGTLESYALFYQHHSCFVLKTGIRDYVDIGMGCFFFSRVTSASWCNCFAPVKTLRMVKVCVGCTK